MQGLPSTGRRLLPDRKARHDISRACSRTPRSASTAPPATSSPASTCGKLAVVTGGDIRPRSRHDPRARRGGRACRRRRAAARRGARGAAAWRGVEVDELDLADLASVSAFRRPLPGERPEHRPADRQRRGHGLPRDARRAGWEAQFATNHLGHYALVTSSGRRSPRGGARVVVALLRRRRPPPRSAGTTSTSRAATTSGRRTASRRRPTRSSPTQLDVARPLRRRPRLLGQSRVHPHAAAAAPDTEEMVDAGWIDEHGTPLLPAVPRARAGGGDAGVGRHLAAARRRGRRLLRGVLAHEEVRQRPRSSRQAERLWTLSAELTGIDAFADSR